MMQLVAGIALYALAVPIGLWILTVAVECLTAVLSRRPEQALTPARDPAPRLAVLVPAHNEQAQIAATLQSILPQLGPGDRLLVVADNCTDATAELARQAGATVVERQDTARRGKGYALAWGIDHLRQAQGTPPDVLVAVDADCTVHDGAMGALAAVASTTGRPVQGSYLLATPDHPRPTDSVSAFAFLVKNLVRPLGLNGLGLPCLLTGSGMAFPWPLIGGMSLASGHLVEDMQLGLDLIQLGHRPVFCAAARITGRLPAGPRAAHTQRRRWEHGHLQTLLSRTPRLVFQALRECRPTLLVTALDVSVPPLSLLCLLWALSTTAALLAWALLGVAAIPAALLSGAGLLLLVSVTAAWLRFARRILPLAALLAAPWYALAKVGLYATFLFRRQRQWVRTERESEQPTSGSSPP